MLDQCHEDLLQFVYEAGIDAAHAREVILERGAVVALLASAVQLCDDLSDGDATYLREPRRDGPLALMVLQQLVVDRALCSRVPDAALGLVSKNLLEVGSAQYVELHTKKWTLKLAREVAEGINGAQQAAYLDLLWWGTPLVDRASEIGGDLGFAVHVVTDAQSEDRRFTSLSASHRALLLADARARCRLLVATGLTSVTRRASALYRVLSRLGAASGSARKLALSGV